jgi:ABC-type glycerol-3-phosphate transport system substrate-binding protein
VVDFGVGKVLFTIASTDVLPVYEQVIAEEAGFSWSLAPIPHTTEQPVVGVNGSGLTILRSSPKEQLAAWLFIKWLAEPEQQARWAREVGCFPTRQSALALLEDYVAEHPQYGQASLLLPNEWVAEPGVPDFAACRAEIERMLYSVTAGQDVNQWLEDTRNFCNQTLENTGE